MSCGSYPSRNQAAPRHQRASSSTHLNVQHWRHDCRGLDKARREPGHELLLREEGESEGQSHNSHTNTSHRSSKREVVRTSPLPRPPPTPRVGNVLKGAESDARAKRGKVEPGSESSVEPEGSVPLPRRGDDGGKSRPPLAQCAQRLKLELDLDKLERKGEEDLDHPSENAGKERVLRPSCLAGHAAGPRKVSLLLPPLEEGRSRERKNMSMSTRLLVVVADDFGYSRDRDQAIVKCFREGLVTCASLLVNGCTAAVAVALAREAGMPLGLHVNLTEGNPTSSPSSVASLLGSNTRFLSPPEFKRRFLSGELSWKVDEVQAETEAQIARFRELCGGAAPLFANGHNHFNVATPEVADAFARACARGGVRFTRVPCEAA